MFKKLIVTGAAAALMLSFAAGAFASEHHQSLPTVTVGISNSGSVGNNVSTSSNTGYNVITGGSVKNSGITTGAATSGSSVTTQLNFNQLDLSGVLGLSGTNVVFSLGNDGTVSNVVGTSANTGFNTIMSSGGSNHREGEGSSSTGVSGSWITTGAAVSSSVVSNVVNTNVFGTP